MTRVFWLHVILLYWIGDYPGIAEAACTMSSGGNCCHWCKQFFPWNYALRRTLHCDFQPFLPPGDPLRQPHRGGRNEPFVEEVVTRTHEQMCDDAEASEAFEGSFNSSRHPRFKSHVCHMCPLAYLPMWDMVWDFMADFMHIFEGYFKSHMIPMFKGERYPSKPKLVAEDADTPRPVRR